MVINAQTSHMNALYIQCCQDRFTNLIIQVISCEKQRAVLNSLSTVLSLPSRTINTAAIGTHIAKIRPANLKTPARLKQPWLIFIAWMGFWEHSSSNDQNWLWLCPVCGAPAFTPHMLNGLLLSETCVFVRQHWAFVPDRTWAYCSLAHFQQPPTLNTESSFIPAQSPPYSSQTFHRDPAKCHHLLHTVINVLRHNSNTSGNSRESPF